MPTVIGASAGWCNSTASLSELVTAAGSNAARITFDSPAGDFSVSAPVTIPSNITLEIRRGVRLVKSGTGAITFAAGSLIDAGPYQIFSGFSAGDISGLLQPAFAEWFGVSGTNDDVAINSAMSSSAAGVQLLANQYNLGTGAISAGGKLLRGLGWGLTTLNQTGSFYAVTLGTNGIVSDLTITGNGAALGGVNILNASMSEAKNLRIQNLTNLAANAVNVDTSYRGRLSFIYITGCATGLRLNNVTTFSFEKGDIASSTVAAIKFAGSASNNFSTFNEVYIESNYVSPVVDATNGNNIYQFRSCGFEDSAVGNNPVIVQMGANDQGVFDGCTFGNFKSTCTGTLTDIQAHGTGDAQNLTVTGTQFSRTIAAGTARNCIAAAAATLAVISRGNYFSDNQVTPATLTSNAISVAGTLITFGDIQMASSGGRTRRASAYPA